jgi:hypothetical protein
MPVVANEIENIWAERFLPTKFESGQASVAQQAPHCGLGFGRLVAHAPRDYARFPAH